MKILFVSALLPYPPHQGGQVRMYNLLKQLSKNHTITLLSFIRSKEEDVYVENLHFCRKVTMIMRGGAWQMKYILAAGLGTKPLLYATYDNELMRAAISFELDHDTYDLIHLEPSYVWPSFPKTNLPVVVTEHNIESTIYGGFVRRFPLVVLRPIFYWDVLKLRLWERMIWQKAGHIVTVSQDDARAVSRVVEKGKVSLVPNGVDIDAFSFRPKVGKYDPDEPVTVLFVGYFGWLQNRDALAYLLDRVWVTLRQRLPNVRLRVVGQKLPDVLRHKLTRVDGTYLPEIDDVVAEYHRADVLLAPIRIGGGTRYKILEAMATGLPVVTTTIGASGLPVANGKEVITADNPTTLVQGVCEVMQNASMRQVMTKRARHIVEEQFSWNRLSLLLEGVWRNVKAGTR